MLTLNDTTIDGIPVITAAGELDVYTARDLRHRTMQLTDAGHHRIVIDIDGCEFLDATGLGVIVGTLKRCRVHDGTVTLVCASERILKVFRITGLARVFGIYPTQDEAVAALREPATAGA